MNEVGLADSLLVLAPKVMHIIRTEMRKVAQGSLTVPQFRVLARLSESPATNREVAEWLGVTNPTLSRMARILIEKKLICQKPDPTDGRQFWLNLTPTGHRQFQSFRTQVKAVFAENIRKLPGSRQSELEAGLNVLTDLVSQF